MAKQLVVPRYAAKIISRRIGLRNYANVAYKDDGNDQLALQEQIKSLIKATEDALSAKNETQLRGIVLEVATIQQKLDQMVSKKELDQIEEVKKQIIEVNENLKKNQTVIDAFVANEGKRVVETKGDFKENFATKAKEKLDVKGSKEVEEQIKNFTHDRNAKITFELKVANMTIASTLTGDGVATYNSRQGLVPAQKINARDLIPSVQSPTGLYVTYRETGSTGALSKQTEGNAKTQIDYAFSEIKTVQNYIAGYARFSKQLMYQLPWLSNNLPKALLRDFYKFENNYLFTQMASNATGNNVITGVAPTIDAEELLMMIANQYTANFTPSLVIVDFAEWARLLATKPGTTTTNYSVPGGVVFDANGTIRIAGIPIIPASWAQTDHALVVDTDFVERVETESLRVEFSYEDQDNFIRNLVTARVECFEELNILRPDSLIYRDFGNS